MFFLLDQNNHANGLELSALSITLTTVESHTIYFTFSWNFLMWFFSMNVVLIFFLAKQTIGLLVVLTKVFVETIF